MVRNVLPAVHMYVYIPAVYMYVYIPAVYIPAVYIYTYRCAKCYQPCATELAKWLPPAEIGRGGNFYCLNVPTPRAFHEGECVSNQFE